MDRMKELKDFDVQRAFELLAAEGVLLRAAGADGRRRWRRFVRLWLAILLLSVSVLIAAALIHVACTPYSYIACGSSRTPDEVFAIANNLFE